MNCEFLRNTTLALTAAELLIAGCSPYKDSSGQKITDSDWTINGPHKKTKIVNGEKFTVERYARNIVDISSTNYESNQLLALELEIKDFAEICTIRQQERWQNGLGYRFVIDSEACIFPLPEKATSE